MTREELIEVMARAMCVYQDQDPDRELESADKHGKPVIMWKHWKGEATAALSALEAAGVRLVPSEPSRQMLIAAHMVERDDIELTEDEHRAMYAAFLAASPYAPAQKDQTHESD